MKVIKSRSHNLRVFPSQPYYLTPPRSRVTALKNLKVAIFGFSWLFPAPISCEALDNGSMICLFHRHY